MEKKGYFFSLDALIALMLVIAIILLVDPIQKHIIREVVVQEDTLKVLSDLKIFETNNSYVKGLIASGKIKNQNNSLLDQIGEFYAIGDPEAENLSLEFLKTFEHENVGIWFNNELIAAKNATPYDASREIWVSRQIVSGIQKGSNVTGFSSRAFLTKNALMKYFYFGGYVGDGNLTAIINYNGTIKSASIEIAVNDNFSLYINSLYAGNYSKGNSTFDPITIDLSSHLGKFSSGDNRIEFKNGQLYIAGGYIAIDYETEVSYESPVIYRFPGIDGIINLYDSFYVPGTLHDMEIFLHYNITNSTIFMTIGNASVYNASAQGEVSTTLNNAQLVSLLDYNALSNVTIPLRLGLKNISQVTGGGNADVILVTDVSGSMNWRLNNTNTGVTRNCSDLLLYDNSTKRISLAKCLAKNFTRIVLASPGNRVGLASFDDNLVNSHALSADNNSLIAQIDSYAAGSGTCTCCGINAAYNLLNPINASRKRFVVLMTDGESGYRCSSSSSSSGPTATCSGSQRRYNGTSTTGSSCGYGCTSTSNLANFNNTIWSSNRTHINLEANVSTIGMAVSNCFNANWTLAETARVGGGIYRPGNNANDLLAIYESLAQSIVQLSYVEQSVIASGLQKTTLYPDSYLKFNYTKKEVPYGIALSYRTGNFGNNITQGSFFIPLNSTAIEVNALSYSGPKWTDNATLNGVQRFLLGSFGNDYTQLGDPFVVHLPAQYVVQGNNTLTIKTGTSPSVFDGGSLYDKVSYTVVKNTLAYSPILPVASGCSWNVTFDDGSQAMVNVPGNYSGLKRCSFSPGNISSNPYDAIDTAVLNLFQLLDVNADLKVDTKFSQQGLGVSSTEIQGIPFTWSSEVQVRAWR